MAGCAVSEAREALCEALCELPNRRFDKGPPFLLLRDPAGRYARAVRIGDETHVLGDWVDPQKAIEGACRVIGEDHRASTHPAALMSMALALVGLLMEGARMKAEEAEPS